MAQINTRIVLRNDTKAEWEKVKDTARLLPGEIGIETDTNLFKVGKSKVVDGETVNCTWGELEYANDASAFQNSVTEVDDISKLPAVGNNIGDIGIVKAPLYDGANEHTYTAYVWSKVNEDGTDKFAWAAMDGNYSAENVFTSKKITLAGNYTTIGNYSKGKEINAGTSLQTILSGMLQTTIQPSVTAPTAAISVSGSQDANEVGVEYTLPTATLTVTAGSYTYGPATGVTYPVWSEDEDTGTFTGVKLAYGADPDSATKFNVNDQDNEGELDGSNAHKSITLAPGVYNGSVTTARYTDSDVSYTFSGKAYHTAGVKPEDNLGDEATVAPIAAGTVTVADQTAKFRGFRYMFAGGTTATEINSEAIRALGAKRKHTQKPTQTGTNDNNKPFEFTATKGATKVIFAFPAGRMSGVSSPKFEIFTMAWGSTEGFVKSEVAVADARGENDPEPYTYHVYTYTPATPLAADSTKYRVYF